MVTDYSNGYIDFLSESVGPKTGTFSIVSDGDLVATATTAQAGVNQPVTGHIKKIGTLIL
jgi:hypothetical protein